MVMSRRYASCRERLRRHMSLCETESRSRVWRTDIAASGFTLLCYECRHRSVWNDFAPSCIRYNF